MQRLLDPVPVLHHPVEVELLPVPLLLGRNLVYDPVELQDVPVRGVEDLLLLFQQALQAPDPGLQRLLPAFRPPELRGCLLPDPGGLLLRLLPDLLRLLLRFPDQVRRPAPLRLQIRPENVQAVTAGLPGFAFLAEMKDEGKDLLKKLKKAAENGELGSLAKRWLGWWDAVPAGDVTDHAEFLPAQEGFIPEERPEFGETVEKRKERILYMNTVREQGADSREGAMAQLLLLSKVPPVRPMKLALALLRKETAEIPAVTRKNNGVLPQLPKEAVVETALVLKDGEDRTPAVRVPEALADILCEVDSANRLAAKAAFGDREALREYVETDPALDGLDRLYCLDVVNALIEMHADVLKNYQ